MACYGTHDVMGEASGCTRRETRHSIMPLDVHFVNTLPALVASRHARESGHPGDERQGDWMPAFAGMTFYWRRTYEMDI